MISSDYLGKELDIFKEATHWKNYWINAIKPYVKGNILEVGSGIGVNSKLLIEKIDDIDRLTCIEPDKKLADKAVKYLKNKEVEIKSCYLKDLNMSYLYDTILYIDVMEHIFNDEEEINLAKSHLNVNGYLIILVPAKNYLYSSFDKAIGHYRRYSKQMLENSICEGLIKKKLFYLDSMGLIASMFNRFFLKQEYPTPRQIMLWDRIFIPLSKISDLMLLYSTGKSLIGIWEKTKV